ncbi:helix-turn-helix domain-containing protein [Sinorhizobium meliloti]|uniref:helix-turn-helix domain-containing protein n=1 Tax=Rhizobium meliloti TaxID=382 RepID=UPI000FE0F124|nr:helix-turn-helix domain-containing protein [Sinorhizobium meliloti]RVO94992.1 DNA-binding protein [Sinorhizobium meliloti]
MSETIFPAVFSVNEAAAYLRTSRRNIYALFKKGDLQPAKVGGRTLVRRSDIDALIDRSIGKVSTPKAARKSHSAVAAGIDLWS